MIYVRILNGLVAELFTPPEGVAIDDCFAPGLVWNDITGVSPQPEPGWIATEAGGGWTYTAPPAPVIPPEQVAATELASRVTAGIAITSTGTPSLDCTMALDAVTMDQIKSVASDFQNGFGLPGDLPTFTYPDINGQPRTFTGAQLVALYRAQRNLLFVLNSQAAVMAHGGPPSWPNQTANIA